MPETLDPVTEIREAAALMRERAAHVPSPWLRTERQVHPASQPGWVIFESGVPVWEDYLASWHPAVALAVADWLDAVAEQAEQHGHSFHILSPGPLRVARSYLGRTDA